MGPWEILREEEKEDSLAGIEQVHLDGSQSGPEALAALRKRLEECDRYQVHIHDMSHAVSESLKMINYEFPLKEHHIVHFTFGEEFSKESQFDVLRQTVPGASGRKKYIVEIKGQPGNHNLYEII
jgi:hypothetical protein